MPPIRVPLDRGVFNALRDLTHQMNPEGGALQKLMDVLDDFSFVYDHLGSTKFIGIRCDSCGTTWNLPIGMRLRVCTCEASLDLFDPSVREHSTYSDPDYGPTHKDLYEVSEPDLPT